MAGAAEIRIDGQRGLAQVGDRSVAIELLADGTLRVGGPAGPRLRRVLYAERAEAVAAARGRDDGASRLRAALRRMAVVERGAAAVDLAVLDALCLHLAGAGVPAPDYARTAALIATATGWSPERIARRPADEIDALAAQLVQRGAASSPAAEPPPGAGDVAEAGRTAEALVARLLRELLGRDAGDALAPEAGAGPSSRAGPGPPRAGGATSRAAGEAGPP